MLSRFLRHRRLLSSTPGLREALRRAKEGRGEADVLEPRAADVTPTQVRSSTLVGLVCYDPSVPSIWRGIMRHFDRCGLDVDFVTFNSYERLVEALQERYVHVAWNGPLAHARCIRLFGDNVSALGMRDVDRDFKTHVVVRDDAGIKAATDLNGKRIAAGTVDSPQAYIMPFLALHNLGSVDLKSLDVTRFDRDLGKHGDTALGEDGVLDALKSKSADAGFISDLMWQRYVKANKTEGLSILESVSVPPFDHCQFTTLTENRLVASVFAEALLLMQREGEFADPENNQIMTLEGIRECWMPPRDPSNPTIGYEGMLQALELWEDSKLVWPGVLHREDKHPFKSLKVDYRLIRDANGC